MRVKKKSKWVISLAINFLIINAYAYDDNQQDGKYSLIVNGISKHFDIGPTFSNTSLNQANYGAGIEYDFSKSKENKISWILNVGEYKDSLNSNAFYIGGAGLYDIYSEKNFYIRGGLQVAGFYSPNYNLGNPFIAPMPALSIGSSNVGVNIVVIPKVPQFLDTGVVFMQLKIGI